MSDSFNIVGIEPGNNLGVSVLEIDSKTLNILSIKTHRFILDKQLDNDTDSITVNKWYLIENIVQALASTYNPLIVAMESAFLNVRFPKAIITLGAYTTVLEMNWSRHISSNRYFKYPPKYVKKIVGKGDADKLDMLKNISSIEEINNCIDPTKISEHEIDATAIAYTALLEVRSYPYVLYSL